MRLKSLDGTHEVASRARRPQGALLDSYNRELAIPAGTFRLARRGPGTEPRPLYADRLERADPRLRAPAEGHQRRGRLAHGADALPPPQCGVGGTGSPQGIEPGRTPGQADGRRRRSRPDPAGAL